MQEQEQTRAPQRPRLGQECKYKAVFAGKESRCVSLGASIGALFDGEGWGKTE